MKQPQPGSKHWYAPDTAIARFFADRQEKRLPRLLLHSCCGPCSSAVLEQLTSHFSVTVFFSNSNITDPAEYQLRLETQKQLIAQLPAQHPVTLLEDAYNPAAFYRAVQGFEGAPEGGERCGICIAMRLDRTANLAAAEGFDAFCTTLSVSPHKSFPVILKEGLALAEASGIPFLEADFKQRSGYQRSVALSAQYGLYRQAYCGCRFADPRTAGENKA